MTDRDQRLLQCLALLSSLLLLAVAAGTVGPWLLYATPLLLLGLPLLAGRYVGEERLARLVGAVQRRRRRPPIRQPAPAGSRWELRSVPRGGRLIAHSLAVRPPPASLLAR